MDLTLQDLAHIQELTSSLPNPLSAVASLQEDAKTSNRSETVFAPEQALHRWAVNQETLD